MTATSGSSTTNSPLATSSAVPVAQQVVGLVGFLAIVSAIAAVGSFASAGAIAGWYADAPKPMWTPPNAVFGPVWTILYTAMAVGAWLVWRRPASFERSRALRANAVQLTLNALWSPTFFALGGLLGAPGLWIALVIIVALNVALLATIFRFADVSLVATWLLVPYWLWALFATTLNAAMAVLAR